MCKITLNSAFGFTTSKLTWVPCEKLSLVWIHRLRVRGSLEPRQDLCELFDGFGPIQAAKVGNSQIPWYFL